MMRFLTTLASTALFFSWPVGEARSDAPKTVARVDLIRYSGLWYEIAKIPNSFQRQCSYGTTADYALKDDGLIQVTNRCYTVDGERDEVTGVARIVDEITNARLKVSFVRFLGKNWFWGDYWIIGLDEDYRWAVVGHPRRKYGWILSRTPEMESECRRQIDELLRRQGYDPALFENTPAEPTR